MDLGVIIAQGTDGWEVAVRAEELGFKTAWFEDSQMVAADPIAMMAVAAMKTSRINLATGVLIPSNRIVPQTANSLTTLNNLAPGRIIMGIGTGFSGRRAMGFGPIKVKDMRSYIKGVCGLMRAEMIEWEFEGKQTKIAFVHADKNLINTTDPIPAYIGAQGPRMRRLIAEVEGNWLNLFSSPELARSDYSDMQTAWADAGNKGTFNKAIITAGCPLRDGETADGPKAMRQGGPLAAVTLHNIMEAEIHGSLGTGEPDDSQAMAKYRQIYESYEPADARHISLHRGHALFVREDEAEFVTGDLIKQTTMTAPVEEIRERVQELARIGYDELTVIVHPGDDDILERWVEVMEGV